MNSDSLIRIRDLFGSQTLAVLATFHDSQPYCNLVAFAGTHDCKFITFATNRDTSKYKNLKNNHQVSLLIDDRTNLNDDFGKNVAITALGLAEEVSPEEKPYFAGLLISKHPAIASFIKGSDNTLFKVRIRNYIVAGFDSVEILQVEDRLP